MSKELQQRLDEINTILGAGLSKEATDGQSTDYNHDTLRAERKRIEVTLGIAEGPTVFRFGRG